MGYNIENDALQETYSLPLKKANGDLMPGAFAVIYGPGSVQYRDVQAMSHFDMVASITASQKEVEPDVSLVRKKRTKRLIAYTKEFVGVDFRGLSGSELVEKIHNDARFSFIGDQILDNVDKLENFMQALPAA